MKSPISETTMNPLAKILAVLVIIAFMVGTFFAYNLWKDKQQAKVDAEKARIEAQKAEAKAKAEAPFFLAAKDALDEANKLGSAVSVGLNYQQYGNELILVAAKLDNLLRASTETGIQNLRPEAKEFCEDLIRTRQSFVKANQWWQLKIEYPNYGDNKNIDAGMRQEWAKAAETLNAANAVFSKLKSGNYQHQVNLLKKN